MNNPKIKITKTEQLSNQKFILNKITYDFQNQKNEIQTQTREVYDRGNGATILLYNKSNKSVILTRQLRIPTYFNGNPSGMMIETCAGMLDKDQPEECIRREITEETGYEIDKVQKIFEAYTSPGAVTEILYFFIGAYTADMKVHEGGGLESEQENIEVLEYNFDDAYNMIASGEIKDAKTIMLLQYAKINSLLTD